MYVGPIASWQFRGDNWAYMGTSDLSRIFFARSVKKISGNRPDVCKNL